MFWSNQRFWKITWTIDDKWVSSTPSHDPQPQAGAIRDDLLSFEQPGPGVLKTYTKVTDEAENGRNFLVWPRKPDTSGVFSFVSVFIALKSHSLVKISVLKYAKYIDIFCWKNVSSFCIAKATHIFAAKNSIYFIILSLQQLMNLSLTSLLS